FIFSLAFLSRLTPIAFYKRILVFGFMFGFLIALPSAFNVIRSGEVVLPILKFSRPYDIWIYHIPQIVGVTREGISGVIVLSLRVINSISVSFLVIYTTPFHEIIKALKLFKIPDAMLMIIILSYNYIFIFNKTIEEIYLAKRARTLIKNNNKEARKWVAGRIVFIFHKTQQRYEDIFKAMLSKGFTGKIKLYGFKKNNIYDYVVGALLFIAEIYFCII
ncbi:MAG: energy-coupling factor transporter transmembrane component T family protein, partial [Dissulfurimicrobium sp.]|uniref:energy-coupling factor transporter transmembrane component T family protein n=1 Tax=Dissulfurimicrobium sp. TaxID=2022436 RepID=UPI004049678D